MLHRVLSLAAALALVGFLGVAVAADKEAPAKDKAPAADNTTHTGTIVTAADGKLTMTGKDGKEHMHRVATDATITCDGKECKLEDLKAGETATITVRKDKDADSVVITKIEAVAAAAKDKDK